MNNQPPCRVKYDRILIIRFSSIGDIVLLSPLFKAVKQLFPEAKVDFLTLQIYASIHKYNPYISNILSIPRRSGVNAWWEFVRSIKINNYQLVIDAHRTLRSRSLRFYSLFCKARWISIKKLYLKRYLLIKFKINQLVPIKAYRQLYLDSLSCYGDVKKFSTNTKVYLPSKLQSEIAGKLGLITGYSYVAIAPGASFELKRWPLDRFYALAQRLIADHTVVIVGGLDTVNDAKWLATKLKKRVINCAGRLGILESCALLSHCQLTITNDSALLHLSEAVKTPVVAIFGATTKEFGFAPHLKESYLCETKLYCRPCSKNGRGQCSNPNQLACLKQVTVEQVFAKAKRLLTHGN